MVAETTALAKALEPIVRPHAKRKWRRFTVTVYVRKNGDALLMDQLQITAPEKKRKRAAKT